MRTLQSFQLAKVAPPLFPDEQTAKKEGFEQRAVLEATAKKSELPGGGGWAEHDSDTADNKIQTGVCTYQ
jgi:hypothetical protein